MIRLLVCAAAALSLGACDCGGAVTIGGKDAGGLLPDGGKAGGTGGSGGNSGSTGGSTGTGGSAGTDGGDTCAEVKQNATLGKKPVDIIMVVDNSGSMTDEIQGIEANINASFASILGAGGLDYRIILLAKHGSATADQSICIRAPLSGNASCNPVPATPSNTANFFQTSVEIGSTNGLRLLLSTYPQWSQNLRPDAFRVILVITDDNESLSPVSFESQLVALMPANFGTLQNKNYLLHAIIGVAQKADPAAGYLSTEPTVNAKCNTAVNTGATYQAVAVSTGGLRFPMCDPSKYNTVFQKIAEGVVAGAQVACEFPIPPPPPGFTLSNKIIVQYTPGGTGTPREFTRVANLASCTADRFYVDANKVIFCPASCMVVKADPAAKVEVRFTCDFEIL